MKKLLLSSLIVTSVFAFAYTQTGVDHANFLAEKGIVTKQSDPKNYRLDDYITRAELVGISLKLKGIPLPENYQCKKYFSDVIANDWICRAVELAADAGFVSRTNTRFRPQDKITRAEAFSILLKSGNISLINDEQSIARTADIWAQKWQKDVFSSLVGLAPDGTGQISGIIQSYEDDQDRIYFTWSPNQPAKRSDIFAASIMILEYRATMSGEIMMDSQNRSIEK